MIYLKAVDFVDNLPEDFTIQEEKGDNYFLEYKNKTYRLNIPLINHAITEGKVLKFNPHAPSRNFRTVFPEEINLNPIIDLGKIGESITYEKVEYKTKKLADINFDPKLFIPINVNPTLDDFWSNDCEGGGLMPATNIMVIGDPGVGKSSFLIWLLGKIKNEGKKGLYVSAEMNEIDMKKLEKYYPELQNLEVFYTGEYLRTGNIYEGLRSILDQGWDFVVLDSLIEIQGCIQEQNKVSSKVAESMILDLMDEYNKKSLTSFLPIQQITKGGDYVGSKRLEHMTTGLLEMRRDKDDPKQTFMMFRKNRRGEVKIKLYYEKSDGIKFNDSRYNAEKAVHGVLMEMNLDDEDESMVGMGYDDLHAMYSQSQEEE